MNCSDESRRATASISPLQRLGLRVAYCITISKTHARAAAAPAADQQRLSSARCGTRPPRVGRRQSQELTRDAGPVGSDFPCVARPRDQSRIIRDVNEHELRRGWFRLKNDPTKNSGAINSLRRASDRAGCYGDRTRSDRSVLFRVWLGPFISPTELDPIQRRCECDDGSPAGILAAGRTATFFDLQSVCFERRSDHFVRSETNGDA
jgi:hypothetical protein